MPAATLIRSTTDRQIAGVAAGLADHFNVDVTLVRVAWVIGTLASAGLGILAYVILWIVLPEGSSAREAVRIAEERYARGEIDGRELDRIRADLEATP